ncbi:alpha/beta hydrolase fold protein [Stanieria cyanosphaera PCC 7437]|uniref:Alpha/beta hydrolase fold protein n=1 Tax=Stanieria cyanosphaera (strain ATCC 29371 / PCC 7437) TaxID=111780 RepID=K9XTY4_STAC7|nr:alpha/beta hydrolase [Stanieria cyanosphaera]AFZ36055.1 alpha/beta hydrolase fold protein [Stanieria cyanosphaera PCC 7437]
MPLIDIRGVDHYYEWIHQGNLGNKPVMVFIHGWGGSARYWRDIATALSDRFDCLLYDLRGFGRSLLPSLALDLSYELEEYGEDLAILLATLGLDEVYVHAHSMGASVATLFINRYSEKVKQAILTCNGIFEYDEKAFAAFYKFGGYVVKFRYKWFLNIPFADRMFMARFLARAIAPEERRAFLEDYLMADYQAALNTIFTCVSKKAVEIMPQEFAKISVPTLMISGEKDIIIPALMGRQAAALNDKIEYVEIANTAHFPMLEDRESYLQVVNEFLRVESVV